MINRSKPDTYKIVVVGNPGSLEELLTMLGGLLQSKD